VLGGGYHHVLLHLQRLHLQRKLYLLQDYFIVEGNHLLPAYLECFMVYAYQVDVRRRDISLLLKLDLIIDMANIAVA